MKRIGSLFTVTIALVGSSLAGCAFEDPGVAGPAGTYVLDPHEVPSQVYEFVDHVSPATTIPIVDDPAPGPFGDRCTISCIDQFDSVYADCTSVTHTMQSCQQKSNEAVNICMLVECLPQIGAGTTGCQATCNDERENATADCIAEMGYVTECLDMGIAAFDGCHAAQCVPTDPVQPPIDDPAPEIDLTCPQMCTDWDNKVYLECLDSGESVQRCRADMGLAEHQCLVAHCIEGTW